MGLTRIRAQQITDIDYKQAVRVVTSENVTLNGGAPNQVDGVNLSTGNRILVNGQTNRAQNGLYQVETVGAGSNGVWIRTNDGNSDGEIDPGMLVMVTEGTAYADTLWKLVTNGTIQIGVTELTFVLNTPFGFGNIYANSTAVIASVQNDVLTLTAGDNVTIVGNATSKSIEFSAVGGIPGGNTTEVQFNNAGVFAGSENFIFDGSNVDISGNVTANYFLGNGSQLSGIITSVANINNGTTNVSIDVANGPVTVGVSEISNVVVVESNQLTFAANLIPSANITYDLGTSTNRWKDIYLSNSSIYLGNVVLSANNNTLLIGDQSVITSAAGDSLTLTGNITGGNIAGTDGTFTNVLGNGAALTGINASNISSGTLSSDRLTGSYAISVTSATTAGTVTTAAQPNITSVGTLTSLSVSGNVTTGNVSGTIGSFTSVTGNGSSLSSITGSNITGTVANATYAVSAGSATSATTAGTVTTAAQPNITSVGTLTSLTVTGLTTHTGNVDITGNVNVTGNLNYANVTDLVVGDPLIFIGANNTGNLFDLGMIVSYNDGLAQHGGWVRDASDGTWKLFGNVVEEPTTTVDFANAIYQSMQAGAITATTGSFSGNVTTGNVSGTTGAFTAVTGNGRVLTSLNASNIDTGTLPADRLSGTYTITVSGAATTAGTVTTAAQPNITSVGTLTSLAVTGNVEGGNVTATGNITASFFKGDGSLLTGISSSGGVTWTTSATAPSSPNPGDFWYDTDDDKKYQYINDGTGNAWVDQSAPTSFGNLTVGNILSGGANGSGNLGSATGYFNTVFSTNGTFTNVGGTLTTAAQPNVTSVGTLTSLAVTGNITGGNVITTGVVASGNVVLAGSTIAANSAVTIRGYTGGTAGSLVSDFQKSLVIGGNYNQPYNSGNAVILHIADYSNDSGDNVYPIYVEDENNVVDFYLNAGSNNTGTDKWAHFYGQLRINAANNPIAIVNSGSNGVGNIGSTSTYFNTVFAKATSAQYADLAENYQADAEYNPGTVVVFGGSAEVTVSDISHDTRVAGVVSTNPSYLMNSGLTGESVAAVALTGRVPCWVQGPVTKGDRIVNIRCGIGGRMKSAEYEPGCIVGKSLEDIADNSVRLIEVVIGRF